MEIYDRRHDTFQRVMVYGTLKNGHGNHQAYLGKAKFLGNVRETQGIMFHIGGYPAINLDAKVSLIHGEVYEVPWHNIEMMDHLEGVPNHYQRVQVKLAELGNTWTYVYPKERCHPGMNYIKSGVWFGRNTPCFKWDGFGSLPEITCRAYKAVPVPERPGWVNLVDTETGHVDPAGPYRWPVGDRGGAWDKVSGAVKEIFGPLLATPEAPRTPIHQLPAPLPAIGQQQFRKPRIKLKSPVTEEADSYWNTYGAGVGPARGFQDDDTDTESEATEPEAGGTDDAANAAAKTQEEANPAHAGR